MAVPREKFIDPRAVRPTYNFQVNHDEEETFGRTRNVTKTANTANTGLVRQQGARDALTLHLSGKLLHAAQHDEMWAWYELCDEQTIYFEDFVGTTFEVTITSFNPVRKRVVRNQADIANAPMHYWAYTLELDVVRIVSGPLSGVITP